MAGTAAQTGNFLEDGDPLLDPFATATAPAGDQSRLEAARRERIRQAARQNASINNSPGGVNQIAGEGSARSINPETGAFYTGAERPTAPGATLNNFLNESARTVAEHPWLPLLPLAPLAMAAAAPAAAGTGSIAAAPGEAAVFTGASAAPAAGAPFSMASPFAAGAAQGAGAAIPAAAGAVGGMGVGEALGYSALAGAIPPTLNAIFGGRTKEEKALLDKQRQMAEEMQLRREQQSQQQFDLLGQKMLAFAPRNRMMAQMFGPEAAFSPTEFAGMVQNPMAPQLPANANPQQQADYEQRMAAYQQAEEARRQQMLQNMPAPGPGPQPLNPIPIQPGRRY